MVSLLVPLMLLVSSAEVTASSQPAAVEEPASQPAATQDQAPCSHDAAGKPCTGEGGHCEHRRHARFSFKGALDMGQEGVRRNLSRLISVGALGTGLVLMLLGTGAGALALGIRFGLPEANSLPKAPDSTMGLTDTSLFTVGAVSTGMAAAGLLLGASLLVGGVFGIIFG